jgi:hypothetical protein
LVGEVSPVAVGRHAGHHAAGAVLRGVLEGWCGGRRVWGMLGAKQCSARVGHLGLVHHSGGLNCATFRTVWVNCQR